MYIVVITLNCLPQSVVTVNRTPNLTRRRYCIANCSVCCFAGHGVQTAEKVNVNAKIHAKN